jgi:aspartate aminotransferase/aminotransferase
VKDACVSAIQQGRNSYTLTQGIPQLRERLQQRVLAEHHHADRTLFISSGTSGALQLAMLAIVDPGDEVILFDPYFVMYKPLVELVGGTAVVVDTYPDFRIDVDRVASAVTPRTKVILVNSPANPTGKVASADELRGLAEVARRHDVLIISDEIYRSFCYDAPFVSPAAFDDRTLVIDGFSKSHGMTGWRLGYAHGPAAIIDTMIKLQQYTYVCAPHPVQWAGLAALDCDVQSFVDSYRQKRDRIVEALAEDFEMTRPGGAFYLFPKVPRGTDDEFVMAAAAQGLLVIPGNIFSQRNTHFRISYAASDETIERGISILRQLCRRRAG